MPKEKTLVDKVADRLRIPETVNSDEVIRWDGEILYVEEETFRRRTSTGKRKRDVTAEVAAKIAKLWAKA